MVDVPIHEAEVRAVEEARRLIAAQDESLQRQLAGLDRMLQERYETQTKAVDAAFLAQQTAMQTALSAAEKAVETALLSAEKAVTKAELAADKRFESVNEFREQLNDQAATFIARTEADSRLMALSEKLETESARLNASIAEMRDQMASERGIYVTIEKYEDRLKGESTAREMALIRVDEKFADYVKRWEQRQREIDIELVAQKNAAAQKNAVLEAASLDAQKIAEEQGREAIAAAQELARTTNANSAELARRTNRNMGIAGIAVVIIVAIANGAGPF